MCLAKQPCSIKWGPGLAHQGLPGPGMGWWHLLRKAKPKPFQKVSLHRSLARMRVTVCPPDLTHSLERGLPVWLDVAPGLEGVLGGSVTEYASRGK